MYLMPANLDYSVKYNFIQHKLSKGLMCAGEDGWDIKLALKHIINDTTLSFTKKDKELAEILLTAFEGREKLQEEHFQIHCKGLGMK